MNGTIQVYRILSTLMICFLHYQLAFPLVRGDGSRVFGVKSYIVVDFFCILSGFLLAEKFGQRKKNYLSIRFINLYVPYATATAIMFLIDCVHFGYSVKTAIGFGMEHILEFAMLDSLLPYMGDRIIPVLWYIPALFIISALIWEFLCLADRAFARMISFCAAVMLYDYYFCTVGNLDVWIAGSLLSDSLLRVAAGMCLGVFCHEIFKKLESLEAGQKVKAAIGFLSFFVQIALLSAIVTDRWYWGDFICVFLFAANIVIAFWSRLRIFNIPVITAAARYCYPVYVCHYIIYAGMSYVPPGMPAPGLVFIAGTAISALLLLRRSERWIRTLKVRLKL